MKVDELFHRAVLVERENFTDQIARFVFETEAPLEFLPGQYATLALESDGHLVQRPYSVCSAPGDLRLEFFCDLVPEGMATPIMWDTGSGAHILVRKRAAGRLVLDGDAQHHLFVATVTGAGPFISMIRHQQRMVASGEAVAPERMVLIHGGSVSAEFGSYRLELENLALACSWFEYVPTVSRPWLDPAWSGELGRVEDVLRKHADAHGLAGTTTTAYACGNPVMVETVRSLLRRSGFARDRIREEKYFEND